MNKKKQKKKRGKTRPPLSRRKKFCFSLVATLIFFGVVETLLFAAGVERVAADPYAGFSNQIPLFVESASDATRLETSSAKLRFFNQQEFAKVKPDNTFRVFTLGGSTTYGRPYNDATSFSGWLRELLPAASSQKNWEVINAGGISYASYRVVGVMNELQNYSPDLFIVYTGHNEFLEERTYRRLRETPTIFRSIGGLMAKTRTFSLVSKLARSDSSEAIASEKSDSTNESPDEFGLSPEVRTRLDNGVGPDAFTRDAQLAENVLSEFRSNLERMISIASDCGAKIIFVTPASNLADCSPFKSEFSKTFDQQSNWQVEFDQAKTSFDQMDWKSAVEAGKRAAELAPDHAGTMYLYGRSLLNYGDYEAAKRVLEAARDIDVCPLRATAPFIATVRTVCDEHRVPLIDFEQIVAQHSPHEIPGESLFLDHVHPTIEGNRMLALELVRWMDRESVVELPNDWDEKIDSVVALVESRIDRRAHGEALRNLSKVLSWAGKQEDANRLALQATELLDNDPEAIYLAGNALLTSGKVDAAIEKFRQVLSIDQNHVLARNSLGSAYFSRGDVDGALQEFLQVVAVKPDFAPAHNNLGSLYQRRREYDSAENHFRLAIKYDSRNSKAHNNLGVLFRLQKKYDLAIESLRQAININPEFAEAYFNLGLVKELQGDIAAAEL
ncbi:MAG: tetratricopeptide repeat protein, partial [Planctomycetales bacterium]|nr:tetratricopeptide repeat protein [Planctomycetales bacterium]